MSPLFYLSLGLIGGAAFCVDLLIEMIRLEYFMSASDYVRLLMQTKQGWGWNDEHVEIEVS